MALEQEELVAMGLDKMNFCLRAVVTPGDIEAANIHFGLAPVQKTRMKEALQNWKLGLTPADALIPTLAARVKRQEGEEGQDECSIRIAMGPQEFEEDGAGLGVIPLFLREERDER